MRTYNEGSATSRRNDNVNHGGIASLKCRHPGNVRMRDECRFPPAINVQGDGKVHRIRRLPAKPYFGKSWIMAGVDVFFVSSHAAIILLCIISFARATNSFCHTTSSFILTPSQSVAVPACWFQSMIRSRIKSRKRHLINYPTIHGSARVELERKLSLSDACSKNPSPASSAPSINADPEFSQVYEPKLSTPSNYLESVTPPSLHGLSKFHLSILSRRAERQRFVTGRYPILVSVTQNPTRKWLNLGRSLREDGSAPAETQILVNGTAPDRSLASIDRFHWIDEDERLILRNKYEMVSIELLAEINMERPGYLHILKGDGAGSTANFVSKNQQMSSDNRGVSSQQSSLTTKSIIRNWRRWKFPDEILEQQQEETVQLYRERLWVTGFSLASRRGLVSSIDTDTCRIRSISARSEKAMLWPNEVQTIPGNLVGCGNRQVDYIADHAAACINTKNPIIPKDYYRERNLDALLVCDGFLVPTKDKGGLYVVKNPGNCASEWTVRLTDKRERWFYHRALFIDLTGDGRQSILTARCKVSTVLGTRRSGDGVVTSGIKKYGQLVWLECPKPASFDPDTGTPLESDGTEFDAFSARHLPWKTRVLMTGPDVMFSVADFDTSDDTIEVISAEFFTKKVTLHSIRIGLKPKVTFSKIIDEHCGQAFGCILADLDCDTKIGATSTDYDRFKRQVVDTGSTVKTISAGDYFSHVLVTSHECSFKADTSPGKTELVGMNNGKKDGPNEASSLLDASSPEGGSLFAYRIPQGKDSWKTEEWSRSTIASGFKVNGQLKNMINPGAPGFVYVFYSNKHAKAKRPMIAVAGDCSESAYIFRPANEEDSLGLIVADPSTRYKLMVEIACSATVGSIGIGYDNFSSMDQETGYAKLYIPCYEKDKVLVFGLGSGEDDMSDF